MKFKRYLFPVIPHIVTNHIYLTQLSVGPYQSHFVITTFINAYTKKLGGSLLPKLFKQHSWPFPYGAFLLAIYGVSSLPVVFININDYPGSDTGTPCNFTI